VCHLPADPWLQGGLTVQIEARRPHVTGVTCFNYVTIAYLQSLSAGDVEDHGEHLMPPGCQNPQQVARDAVHYFKLHFTQPIEMPALAKKLGTSLRCLNFSFDRIHGVTPFQALQELRLNHLFAALTDHPRQGIDQTIRACGLSETPGVSTLFEQEFGIDIPLFLHISRRAADDRQFRLEHPEAEALVLPL
jgi:AraC-like DNA-binding protein